MRVGKWREGGHGRMEEGVGAMLLCKNSSVG